MSFKLKRKRKFINSVKDCINGLDFIMKNEDNFKRELILAIISLFACIIFKVNKTEFTIVIIVISLVLVSEIINTAIEKTVDLYTKEYNKIAKIVKDVSAFAVLTACFFAVTVGIIIFIPKIIILLGGT